MKIEGKSLEVSTNTSKAKSTTEQNVEVFNFAPGENKDGLTVESRGEIKEIKNPDGTTTKMHLSARSSLITKTYDKSGKIIEEKAYDYKGKDPVKNIADVEMKDYELAYKITTSYDKNKKHETSFTPDGKIKSYKLKNEFDQLLECISYDEKGQVTLHSKTYYDEIGIQRGYEDLTEKYALQDQGRMKVYHDEKGAITKTVERITKGVIVITEYKNNKEIVKAYAPKDPVYWEEPDLNNINWDNYELMPD